MIRNKKSLSEERLIFVYMSEGIPAVYDDVELLKTQKKELSKIIGIGSSNKTDVARKHDKYLY